MYPTPFHPCPPPHSAAPLIPDAGNCIGDEGAQALAETLKTNSAVQLLILTGMRAVVSLVLQGVETAWLGRGEGGLVLSVTFGWC